MRQIAVLALFFCLLAVIAHAGKHKNYDNGKYKVVASSCYILCYDTTNPRTREVLKHSIDILFVPTEDFDYTDCAFTNPITKEVSTAYRSYYYTDSATSSFAEFLLDKTLLNLLPAISVLDPDLIDSFNLIADSYHLRRSCIHNMPDIHWNQDPITGEVPESHFGMTCGFHEIKMRVKLKEYFNGHGKKVHTEILYLAPVRSEYGDDGSYRGMAARFYVRFDKAQPFIERYEKIHPECIISKEIEKLKKTKQPIYEGRKFTIPIYDTQKLITSTNDSSSLHSFLRDQIKRGTISSRSWHEEDNTDLAFTRDHLTYTFEELGIYGEDHGIKESVKLPTVCRPDNINVTMQIREPGIYASGKKEVFALVFDIGAFKYEKIEPLIKQYERDHPECIITKQVNEELDKTILYYVTNTINIYDTTNAATRHTLNHAFKYIHGREYNFKPKFFNAMPDTIYPDRPFADSLVASFPEYLLDAILKGKIIAQQYHYSPYDSTTYDKLKPDAFEILKRYNQELHDSAPGHFYPEYDTVVTDSIIFNNAPTINVITLHERTPRGTHYMPNKNKKQVVYIDVTLTMKSHWDKYPWARTIYSLKYADALPFIKAYERIHPECIISKEIEKLLNK